MTNLNNEFDYSKTYYKVLRKDMTHRGFKYEMGLNIDTNEFNDNLEDECVKGGLYFVDFENIYKYIAFGEYLAEIIIPEDAKVVKIESDDSFDIKYRTDKFIIENISPLNTLDSIHKVTSFIKNDWFLEETIKRIFRSLVICKRFSLAKNVYYKYKMQDNFMFSNYVYYFVRETIRYREIREDVIKFLFIDLNWISLYSKNSLGNNYFYMNTLRDSGNYDRINFIYDNNL